jgi:hypothetical protein
VNAERLPASTPGRQRLPATPSMLFHSGRSHITVERILLVRTSLSQLSRWVRHIAELPKRHFPIGLTTGKPEPAGLPPAPPLVERPSSVLRFGMPTHFHVGRPVVAQ